MLQTRPVYDVVCNRLPFGNRTFLFQSIQNKKTLLKNYAKILEFFVICGALILLIVVVFVDVLKLILIPNEAYWEAMKVVPILLLAYLFLGIYHNLSVWYKITDRTKFGAYISVIGAGITLLVNLMFITSFNYMASAMATLAAYFFNDATVVLFWSQALPNSLQHKKK